ncbi:hypothetical protein M153_5000029747 [Pseudoloma neurophilia]|uniref:Uncharacterized protein n=1 Tax=Pseudoloma neurophilia TaxID=146866 RepID=A0A0R0M621_9MICR|nr:hypothetical protein M153_5000029747 [Pseudoloma neurophilia]
MRLFSSSSFPPRNYSLFVNLIKGFSNPLVYDTTTYFLKIYPKLLF